MRVERLRLTDFRNYASLDLALPRGLIVLQGRNAQGKSNVLEAITIAATSRSFRTTVDRELVRFGAPGRFARIEAQVARAHEHLTVEVIIADTTAQNGTPLPTMPAPTPPSGGIYRKRVRINGAAHRAMDLLGRLTMVLFSPTDLDLVIGSPLERRRFMDVTLCQVDSAYCRALSQYQKVATQRAALLRRIRDGEDTARALTYWDEQLAHDAAPVVRTRAAFLAKLQPAVARHYAKLTADAGEGDEPLRLVYAPSYDGPIEGDDATVAAAFRERLDALRRRELAQGVNVLGPHRDDLAFFAGPLNLATYGSRGQQRTVALALKLGELEFIEGETHEQPVLLLDDVLSELDASRRQALLHAVAPLEQVLLTVADATSVPAEALAAAHVYTVRAATLEPQS